MPTTIAGLDDLKGHVGQHLGHSDWHEVSQSQVDGFADATGDHQWIHVDPERAKGGPFGRTIAHGYLTISLAPALLQEVWTVQGFSMGLNYGINKLRFPSPVPVGERVRVGATLAEVRDVAGGVEVALDIIFEVQGQEKPACVAQVVYRYYP
ncbi:MAG: MaoC family dehydratase [Acidimicrobiales bacterium]